MLVPRLDLRRDVLPEHDLELGPPHLWRRGFSSPFMGRWPGGPEGTRERPGRTLRLKAGGLLLPIHGEVARRAGGGRGIYQSSQPLFELPQSDVLDLQRQPEVLGDAQRFLGEARVGHLAEIEDGLVVGEQNRLQVWMPVEPKPAHHRAVEVAYQPVGEEERAWPPVGDLRESLLAREDLVAVRAAQAGGADLVEQRLQLPGRPAIAVHHDQLFVSRSEVVQLFAQLVDDARRIKVEERRHSVDVDVPAAAVDDVLDLAAERAADDE